MKFKHYFRDIVNGHIWASDSPENWKYCEKLPKAEGQRLHRLQAATELRKLIKPGDMVYTCLRSVSSSGMSRQISVHVPIAETRSLTPKDGGKRKHKRVLVIRDVSNYVATLIDERQNPRNGALIVGGCGMDMGFHVVYSLGRVLYPAKEGQRDGGYSLKHEWL